MMGLKFRDAAPDEKLPALSDIPVLQCFYMSEVAQKRAGWSICFSVEDVNPAWMPHELALLRDVCNKAADNIDMQRLAENPSIYHVFRVPINTRFKPVAVFIHMMWHVGAKQRKRG